jgi:hypothetical protein
MSACCLPWLAVGCWVRSAGWQPANHERQACLACCFSAFCAIQLYRHSHSQTSLVFLTSTRVVDPEHRGHHAFGWRWDEGKSGTKGSNKWADLFCKFHMQSQLAAVLLRKFIELREKRGRVVVTEIFAVRLREACAIVMSATRAAPKCRTAREQNSDARKLVPSCPWPATPTHTHHLSANQSTTHRHISGRTTAKHAASLHDRHTGQTASADHPTSRTLTHTRTVDVKSATLACWIDIQRDRERVWARVSQGLR